MESKFSFSLFEKTYFELKPLIDKDKLDLANKEVLEKIFQLESLDRLLSTEIISGFEMCLGLEERSFKGTKTIK